MSKQEKSFKEERDFILEHVKHQGDRHGKTIYQINQEPFIRFMKNRGLSKATLDQVTEANRDFLNGTIAAATKLYEKHKDADQVIIRSRTPNGRIDTAVKKTVVSTNPTNGEKIVKHGVVSIRSQMKSQMDKDILDKCRKAIESIV